jgi:hypothetical protein
VSEVLLMSPGENAIKGRADIDRFRVIKKEMTSPESTKEERANTRNVKRLQENKDLYSPDAYDRECITY